MKTDQMTDVSDAELANVTGGMQLVSMVLDNGLSAKLKEFQSKLQYLVKPPIPGPLPKIR